MVILDRLITINRNRLTAITTKDGTGVVTQTVGYEYDVDDQRVSKTVNGVVEKYIIDRNQIAYVTDGSGTQTFHYLYGTNVDAVMAQDSPTGMVWSLTDRLGSVNLLADAGGVIVDKRTFDSFGRILSESNPSVKFRYGYTGRETDGETGLYYYRARYYDAANGRFISVDPAGFGAGDTNLYRYVGNSSTGFTDPTGEFAFLPILGLIALGGLIAGALDVVHQDLKIIEGSQEQFNFGEFGSSVGLGAVLTPLAAASPAFAVGLGAYGAITGSGHGLEEIGKGNWLSGGFEVATSLLPLGLKGNSKATGNPFWNAESLAETAASLKQSFVTDQYKVQVSSQPGYTLGSNFGNKIIKIIRQDGTEFVTPKSDNSLNLSDALPNTTNTSAIPNANHLGSISDSLETLPHQTRQNVEAAVRLMGEFDTTTPVGNPTLGRTLDGINTHSGWKSLGEFKQGTNSSFELAKEIGYPFKAAGFMDGGMKGRYFASHTEVQMAGLNPNEQVFTHSNEGGMCSSCSQFFKRLAQHSQVERVVADPTGTYVFKVDGTVDFISHK